MKENFRRDDRRPEREENENQLEGRNALTEALRSGRTMTRFLSPPARLTGDCSIWLPRQKRPVQWSFPLTAAS